jgi:phosphate/sulfate permease
VTLPVSVAGVAAAWRLLALAEGTGSLVLGWLARLAPIAAAWVQAPLLAGFLSYAYLFLTRTGASPSLVPGGPA